MSLENLFSRNLDGSFNFVANRQTGKWVLTEETNLSKLPELTKDNSIPPKKHRGTAMTLLNVGRGCNLGCTYCHVQPEKTSEKMSSETGKRALDRIAELNQSDQLVIFHGSEPLVNFELIKELVLYGNSIGVNKFGMQTNGTLLDEEKLDFFARNNVGVGVSIDGLERHHNTTRPFRNGAPSYEQIMKNVEKAIEYLGGISAITVVSDHNVSDLEEIARHFEDNGIFSVRFSPLHPNKDGPDHSPDIEIYTEQMTAVYDRYLQELFSGNNPIKAENFQSMLRTIFAPKETTNCVKCSGGSRQPLMAIDIEGTIYPCDFFWDRKDYKIGNIKDTAIQEAIESESNFRNHRVFSSLEDCQPCDWKTYCGAGCPGASVMAGEGLVSKDPYCEHTKAMFEYVVRKIPKLHEKGLISKILN